MSRPLRAVIFDLDGTLLDSMPLVLRAFAHALEPYRPPLTDDALRARLGGPPERIFQGLLADSSHVTGALLRLEAFGAENWALIEPFPGMAGLLRGLRAAGVKQAVWTGRERASAEWLLRKHGIQDFLQACVCGDDLSSHKPDPAGLDETLRQLGIGRDEALFVGDAAVDLQAGVSLGIRTLLISHGLEIDASLAGKAWKVAGTPTDAYACIGAELIHGPGGGREAHSVN